MAPLERIDEWRSDRPTDCRHCSQPLNWGEPAIFDPDSPWLAFHLRCIHELAPERIVRAYDRLTDEGNLDYSERKDLEKSLTVLRDEVLHVTEILDGRRKSLTGMFRPGIRRELPPRR